MESVTGRIEHCRAYLRAVKRGEVIFGPVLLPLLLSAAIIWVGYEPDSREAAGQEKAREATVPALEPAAPIAPLFPELTLPDLSEDQPKADRRPAGIPRFSSMEVIGHMQYLPGTPHSVAREAARPAEAFTSGLVSRPLTMIPRSSTRSR
jgi:hypothetical protein